jgi:hypothetical protein
MVMRIIRRSGLVVMMREVDDLDNYRLGLQEHAFIH